MAFPVWAILKSVVAFLRGVPREVWLLLALAAAIGAALLYHEHAKSEAFKAGDKTGASRVQKAWDEDKAKQQAEIDRLKLVQSKITVKTEVVYRDRIKVVHEKGQTLIQRIPAEIPADACLLPVGFRRLHDDAARGGAIPGTAGRPDAGAGPAETVAWRPWNTRGATGGGQGRD